MARQFEPYVLLGFEDERVTEKNRPFVDYTTNKIGGTPDWHPTKELPLTKCKLCGSNLALVVQIYAPVEGSKFHRTLYLFACIQPPCWNRPESWLCVRQQSLSQNSPDKESETSLRTTIGSTSWGDDADNWGADSDEDENLPSVEEENGNVIFQKPQRPHEDTDTDESCSIEDLSDPNANSAGAEGAFAVEFNSKCAIASAEIEIGDESEIVSIDTPTQPRQVSELFSHPSMPTPTHPEFLSSFISVAEEVPQEKKAKLTEHELSLLQAYQQSELGGGDVIFDGRKMKVEVAGGAETTGEQYEKDLPSHGDVLAHRFISRLQESPGQVLRYGLGADPMLLKPLPKQKLRCNQCGSDLTFEMQLLPPLLTLLHLTQGGPGCRNALEFGNVLVFTCPMACWDQKGYQEERIIIQAE
ncbi:programmed cell death protein 2-like [Neocloeon triangulifer]|uniref:programmed cell death protein 2-like n=1 Tax=Neocloeon triangulifer TaxID=2078957 RepID=UPI00286F9FC3|nr:programmed cell death protein 2-like [Neocloeon triangulifer]